MDNLASNSRRFVSWFIDGFITGIFAQIILTPVIALNLMDITSTTDEVDLTMPVIFISIIFSVTFVILYFAIFESSKFQATPGKMLLKIKVVNTDGERLKFGQALKRSAFRNIISDILNIGYIVALFREDKKALHDMFAKTRVIKK